MQLQAVGRAGPARRSAVFGAGNNSRAASHSVIGENRSNAGAPQPSGAVGHRALPEQHDSQLHNSGLERVLK